MQLVIRTFNNRSTQNFISNLIYIKWIEHWAISVEIDSMMKWHRTPNTTKNNLYVYDNRFNVDVLYSSMSNLFARGYDFWVYIYTDILRFFCKGFRLHAGSKSYRGHTGTLRRPYGNCAAPILSPQDLTASVWSPCGDPTATVRTSWDPSGLRFCQSAELNLLLDYL